MANIRIKDLPSTATLEADDRVLIDSLTEGTRSIDKDDFLSELAAEVPGYAATSTSSQTIGSSGTKTFTTQDGLAYQVGTRVRAADASDPTVNWMEGVVTSYSSTTLAFTADKSAGSGTLASWVINVAGQPGADGAGSGDVSAASNFGTDNRLIRSDGATKGVQASGIAIDDSDNMSGVAAFSAATVELGHASDTTITRTGAGAIAVEGVGVALNSTSLPHTASQVELGHASDTTLTRSASGVVAVEGVDLLKKNGNQTLTGGFISSDIDAGTKSSGTYTPDPTAGNIQRFLNNGAFTLDPPTNPTTMVLRMQNGASAGAVTVSGFTKVTGDSLTTTNGHLFFLYIAKVGTISHLHKQAMQ